MIHAPSLSCVVLCTPYKIHVSILACKYYVWPSLGQLSHYVYIPEPIGPVMSGMERLRLCTLCVWECVERSRINYTGMFISCATHCVWLRESQLSRAINNKIPLRTLSTCPPPPHPPPPAPCPADPHSYASHKRTAAIGRPIPARFLQADRQGDERGTGLGAAVCSQR